jgi:SEC-C motif-containing protein
MQCYCGSGQLFDDCCQPLLSGLQKAQSCEQLMRSRYSAFCHAQADYLQQSCLPGLREQQSPAALQPFLEQTHFTELQILNASQADAEHGFVVFKVYFIQANQLHSFQEHSLFERIAGQWYYASGQLIDFPSRKLSRNDPCPCGSGQKFKSCSPHQPSGQAAS